MFPPRLISLALLLAAAGLWAQEAVYRFEDPLLKGPPFPVYAGAEADVGYADLAKYIVAFMHGSDERSLQAWAWHTQDGLDPVRAFYTGTLGYPLECEKEDHQAFMKKHWTLFLGLNLPQTEGAYVHCAAGTLDLFSPVYNYARKEWQDGTMIVFRR